MKKFYVFVLLICSLASLASAKPDKQEFPRYNLEGIQVPQLGQINEYYPIEPSRFYLINSPGGIIDTAFIAGVHLQGKTCIIKYAASAALQILLPYCKDRYYLPDAQIQFHSAHVVFFGFGSFMMSMWDAASIFESLVKDNKRMIQHMLSSGFPGTDKQVLQWAKDEVLWKGDDLGNFKGWARPIHECRHCPLSWQKLGAPAEQTRRKPQEFSRKQ